MKKLILVAMAGLSLSACAIPGLPTLANVSTSAPAPLERTTVDDQWLATAWKSHDALQDALNLYMDAKPSVIGTPAMKRMADINDAITAALTAAESAAAAGSETDYLVAIAHAKQAFTEMRGALMALKGK